MTAVKIAKLIGLAALGAFFVLGGASVWMGGLNQDEGWYLYAAQLAGEGQMPYRDFFYTQGPLMPIVYSAFAGVWKSFGLLGARVLTLALGALGIALAAALAARLVPEGKKRRAAALIVFILLGNNLYHLYYLTIPKTYALAGLFVLAGFYFLSLACEKRTFLASVGGLALAFAAGTRISLGALLGVVGLALLFGAVAESRSGVGGATASGMKCRLLLIWFCLGGFLGLALAYGPFLCDAKSLAGLVAAQKYHAARGGFDIVWTVGSFSRLVRWYLPVFVLFGLGVARSGGTGWTRGVLVLLAGFLAVFAVQMLAPFPYEDYQVPVMSLLAIAATVVYLGGANREPQIFDLLLVFGMAWAGSFGSPLLEKWSTNGQDRFWSLKKDRYELPQLRETARKIEAMDPGGRELLTQDLYLAVECGRRVPRGLEMGPFAILSDAEWKTLLESAPCEVAALSGYSFAIEPPVCTERPIERQMEYWSLLKRRYALMAKVESFGQNATPLLILKRTK